VPAPRSPRPRSLPGDGDVPVRSPRPHPLVCAASELTLRPVQWLWPGRLALGKLALLEGDPGLSKSLLTLDLCARLSTGRPMPDGSPGPEPASALVLNCEDNPEDTVLPRLQALGAYLPRVFVPRLDAGARALRLPADGGILDAIVAATRARLVVLDPVMAFLGSNVAYGSEPSVRQALEPLERLAHRHACAVLLLRHLNKSGGAWSLYRGAGSIAFLAACRLAWVVGPDPRQPDQCVLAQVKNNLGPAQPSLAYRVRDRPGGAPTLDWLGPSPLSARDLQSGAVSAPAAAPREHARDFLTAFLGDGPRTAREIWAAAQEQGLTERTLQRAKAEEGIRSLRAWADGKLASYWLLPGQAPPASVPAQDVPPDLEEWLAPLREQFPPPTPLDDL
jgi:hypothetical protein